MIASVLELKTIPDMLDTNSTHTSIAHVHPTAPDTGDYMGYVRTLWGKLREAAKITCDYLG